MRTILFAAAVLAAASVTLSGCASTPTQCAAGSVPVFFLKVVSRSAPEPSVRFCDSEQCSPVPVPGAIPSMLSNQNTDHPTAVYHLSAGQWSIRPGGTKEEAPSTATIRLYRNGTLVTTRRVHLTWPHIDPCAATNPPQPHVSITVP